MRRQCDGLPIEQLETYAEAWLMEGEMAHLSPCTLSQRRTLLDHLTWYLKQKGHAECGSAHLREFQVYLGKSHEDPNGRWGNPNERTPLKATTIRKHLSVLSTFFSYLADEGFIEHSPMEGMRLPKADDKHTEAYTKEQVEAMLAAARRSADPRRNEALLCFLIDTGLRASEVCSLRTGDVDLKGRVLTVIGKGRRTRTVGFGATTGRALIRYISECPREHEDPLFLASGGTHAGQALTRSGVYRLIRALGDDAGVSGVRVATHTCRHYFAIQFLRAGGNQFDLQRILGHSDISTTGRYVAPAQTDLEAVSRQFSPADRLNGAARARRK